MPFFKFRSPRQATLVVNIVFVVLLILVTVALLRRNPVPAKAEAPPPQKLRLVSAPSPHHRAMSSRKVDTVVVHYISGINVDCKRWAEPQVSLNILKRYGFSAHYLLDRSGTAYQLVQERNIAWHAGGSIMPAPDNRRNVNRFSIGIEVIATAESGYTDAQYRALAALIAGIKQRHPIRHIVGHDQISGARAVRLGLRKDVKQDPGPLFAWKRLHTLLRDE